MERGAGAVILKSAWEKERCKENVENDWNNVYVDGSIMANSLSFRKIAKGAMEWVC